jgi:hypothetical protein
MAIDEGQKELECARITAQRVVREPTKHPFNRRDFPRLATFSDRNFLANDILQDRSDAANAFPTAPRIATLSGSKAMRYWRSSIANLAIHRRFIGHLKVPARFVAEFLLRDRDVSELRTSSAATLGTER